MRVAFIDRPTGTPPTKSNQNKPHPRHAILQVCGGDGTASRVFEVVDSMDWRHSPPRIAILPLGTGNDLARLVKRLLGLVDGGGSRLVGRGTRRLVVFG